MISVFNRREVMYTYSTKEQVAVCRILQEKGIEYCVKPVSRSSAVQRAHGRKILGDACFNVEYKIYVHKKDVEYALALLTGGGEEKAAAQM